MGLPQRKFADFGLEKMQMLTYSSLPNVQFNYLGNTQTDHSADILDGLGLLAVVLRGERWVTRGGGGGVVPRFVVTQVSLVASWLPGFYLRFLPIEMIGRHSRRNEPSHAIFSWALESS